MLRSDVPQQGFVFYQYGNGVQYEPENLLVLYKYMMLRIVILL